MKKIVPLMFLILMAAGGYCLAYDPPIGIPAPPSVLMDADVDDYIGQTYNFSLDGRGVQTYPISSVTGKPYTHYVDKDDPSATDTDNPYGTEATPRLTLPIDIAGANQFPQDSSLWLAAGSVVEVHNGPYAPVSVSALYVQGTAQAPCFIRGGSNGELGDFTIQITGDYLIIENLTFSATNLFFKYTTAGMGGSNHGMDYFCVRNNTFVGNNTDGVFDNQAIDIYGLPGGSEDNTCTYGLIYNNTCSYYGYVDETTDDTDNCFIYIWGKSQYMWILDNHSHHNGGDCVQIGNNANRETRYIYVGNNEFHDDRENAVDIKEAQDVIISQNEMYNYLELGRPDDGGIAGTHQGTMAGGDCPKNIWYIFNDMHDATYVAHSSHSGDEIYFIGNIIHDIAQKAMTPFLFTSNEHHYYINNTFYNNGSGIIATVESADVSMLIANNILSNFTSQPYIWIDVYPDTADMDYNLFYKSGGSALLTWDDTSYTLSQFQSTFSEGLNCIEADPLFVDAGSDNFHLDTGSPAIGQALSSTPVITAFNTFYSLYGIDIKKDIEGKTRTEPWDMGAYESDGGGQSSGQYLIALIELMKNQMYTTEKVIDYKIN